MNSVCLDSEAEKGEMVTVPICCDLWNTGQCVKQLFGWALSSRHCQLACSSPHIRRRHFHSGEISVVGHLGNLSDCACPQGVGLKSSVIISGVKNLCSEWSVTNENMMNQEEADAE